VPASFDLMQEYFPVSWTFVDDINKSPVSSMRILSFNDTNKSKTEENLLYFN